jgi:multicomponent Na+:H+ antiporter subunit D
VSGLLISPLGACLFGVLATLACWRAPRLRRVAAVAGSGGLLASGLVLLPSAAAASPSTLQVGGWPAPFGITLTVDALAVLMVLLGGAVGLAATLYAMAERDAADEAPWLHPLIQTLLLGTTGAFLAGDLFNLYVWFEVLLVASFGLLATGRGGDRPGGALHYVAMNLLSSALFLLAIGLTYSSARSLNMADLGPRLREVAELSPGLVHAIAALLLVAFGIKAGLVPLHFWLPASYHRPSPAISALFAGLLTKVGLYAMIRVLGPVVPIGSGLARALLVAALVTMLVGVLGAVGQGGVRRVLGFHIVSQIGYMALALALAWHGGAVAGAAMVAALFYVAHHILVKTNLYLVSGTMRELGRSESLGELGGLARRSPWLIPLFLVPALSLAGLPPLSGFWAKLAVFRVTLAQGAFVSFAVAAAAGLLTLVSMMKIWMEAFWKPAPSEAGPAVRTDLRFWLLRVGPSAGLALGTLAIGLAPGWLLGLVRAAAGTVTGGATGGLP